ncbi:uncharacterized protein LOC133185935 [Saccostrea echinata]|uniref:uncharacterized protein LOC133185935 n=1 Tax=Saccostrea echinata TaxID=191078 RepID=UPI002A816EEC|nr:uncharacterized protein LOC133185935 [Saccostrea echinata]
MKSHCKCQINPRFTGVLKFASNMNTFPCDTQINIFENDKPDTVLRLPCGPRISDGFHVTHQSVIFMTSKYINSTNGIFYQEITIFEDRTFNGTISVICGADLLTSMPTVRIKTTDYTKLNITVSSQSLTEDIQTEKNKASPTTKCASTNYLISGFSGAAIGVLLTVIITIVVCHLRKTKPIPKTTGLNDETNTGQENNDTYDELRDNPPYQSYQPPDNEPHIYIPLQITEEKSQMKKFPLLYT